MSQMTVTGNLVHDPVVKQAGNNKSVLNITIAENFRANRDAEEVVTYVDVTLWDSLAENFGASVMKGDRVFATGRVRQERWESTSGEKRSKLVIVAESAGVDLRFHTAVVTKATRRGDAPEPSGRARATAHAARSAQYDFDEEPF